MLSAAVHIHKALLSMAEQYAPCICAQWQVDRNSVPIVHSSAIMHTRSFPQLTLQGTPPQMFQVIVDSGSALTYVPCQGCDHCGDHISAPLDTRASSTHSELQCADEGCHLYCGHECCFTARADQRCRCAATKRTSASCTHLLRRNVLRVHAHAVDLAAHISLARCSFQVTQVAQVMSPAASRLSNSIVPQPIVLHQLQVARGMLSSH